MFGQYSHAFRTSVALRFSNQISITSLTGAGSSSLLQGLKEVLGEKTHLYLSMGDLMRQRATEVGMSIEELAAFNKEHPEAGHDRWCDGELQKRAERNFLICEGRIPHIWMRYACKVLLVCDLDIRAERRRLQKYPDLSVAEVRDLITKRDDDDRLRYDVMYPGWNWCQGQYDVVINTGQCSKENSVRFLLEEHRKHIMKMGNGVM